MPKKKTKDIQVITGETNPNILLIAPHGVNGDDDNTGKLARAIRKLIGCNAIINEAFKKPEKNKNGQYGDPDIENRLADLNYIPHAQVHPRFIEDITNNINDPGNTHVFWIHGIDDDNLTEEKKKYDYGDAKCLVGYGQGNGNGYSMVAEKTQQLVNLLTENGLSAVETNENSEDYRGASATNMNQYFKKTDGDLAGVQSVQLEFAKEGVRVGKSIAETAVKVAKAISILLKCETIEIPEEKPDADLVKEATKMVMKYVATNHKNNVEVGHYLIKQFYGNDYEKAKLGKKVKKESLNAMLDDLQKKGNAPSKSWFYNAVNLAVDDKAYEDDPDYKKLNLSHKIYLTSLNKEPEWETGKLGLIKKIAKKGMAIKDLWAEIAKIKGKSEDTETEIVEKWPSKEEIVKMADEKKKEYKEKAVIKQQEIQDFIAVLEKQVAEKKAELSKFQEIIEAVEGLADQEDEQEVVQTDGQQEEQETVAELETA
jgi:hypothetical protein